MACYEGAKMIKTFRGLMADGAQDTIVLHTNDGSIGYRIVKFQVMENEPGAKTLEGACKIYKVEQTAIDNVVDFSDNTLLGAADYNKSQDSSYSKSVVIIFDQEVFNQDIYVTWKDNSSDEKLNYYIELEQIKLDLNSNTVATLKDMRNTASPRP